ncbi:hypothetical protein [Streptomyces sp. NPDC004284]|uniref:hypothetical protein n=1 Tax=Streptomyces sp. NPDC004284 TaxID=3364695 RepID=UPI0036BAC00F
MNTERRGRTAPWGKAVAAVLLALLVTLVALVTVSRLQESARERNAFEATRADADRFADVLAAEGATPSEQDVRDAFDAFAGGSPQLGTVVGVRPTGHGTRVLVLFSRPYERTQPLFGPADAMATRCFTIDLPGAGRTRPVVTAHGPEESCTGTAAAAYPYAESSVSE